MGDNEALRYAALKGKERRRRSQFPQPVALRVHRAISWVQAGERAMAQRDEDLAFVSYWVAFNACYSQPAHLSRQFSAQEFFEWYFKTILELDRGRVVYDAIWMRFAGSIRNFLNNRFVFEPFWRFHHGEEGCADWKERFDGQLRYANKALGKMDTAGVLAVLFSRLYVLRNQLMHGGATWKGSVNREQVRQGTEILAFLVPHFIDLMMDHPDVPWGLPPYPVLDRADP